ncbi:UDP-N-acetylglucosamine--N-acetylmuramyl-(pentapeptide) pyrophosphoryl-undecaprenol N-acetylglucosamine transferase, partial [Vagococcus penaei]
GRAGATSLAEITSLGLPSIMIPSPNVTNDHQTKNAQSLVKRGASVLLADGTLTSKQLIDEIDQIMLNEELRLDMAKASKAEGIPDANDRLYNLIKSLV